MNATNSTVQADDLRSRAAQQIRSNQLDAAKDTLESLIRRNPEDVPACLELADVLFKLGHMRASSAPLLQAVEHLPKNAPLLLHLIHHLIARGEVVAARNCLDFLAQAPDPPASLLVAQAHHRFTLGEIHAARALIERAIEQGADDPDDHHMHAMLLQFSGDIDEAIAVLDRCLERWPHYGDAMTVRVNLRKQTPEHNHLSHIEAQLRHLSERESSDSTKFVRAEFEYARFKVLDDLGRTEEAWPALARCNALMHELNPYDREDEQALIDAFIDTPEVVAASAPGKADFEGPVPIFIVGMPRSGTTLLDRMLSSHSQVSTAGELVEFWRQLHWVADERPATTQSMRRIIERCGEIDFREVGARYLQQTQWRAGESRFYIDKLPANMRMVAFIRRALPHAPILHMSRDPMDVCFSNYKALFGNVSSYSYDLEALAHSYRCYARLRDHWHAALPGAMMDVPYASLVGDPEATMREVLAHCGLDVESACLHPERNEAPVATPSSAQVREPIHTRGIGQWKRYAEPMQSLHDAIADLL
ncbi:hypothetical protein GCM10027285_04980 [Oleiagrimonas citrea]|uniref:Tetratricopeptide repeat protein n=1 Tax=Oleiagrimonas citrea TaxID=1665687 RepID=A0A846ZNF6_9GAMM|nr:tetratricopeptide repeat protein [Oleiagrimonas citrea]